MDDFKVFYNLRRLNLFNIQDKWGYLKFIFVNRRLDFNKIFVENEIKFFY